MESDKITFLLMFVLFVVTNILSAQAVTSANGDTIYILPEARCRVLRMLDCLNRRSMAIPLPVVLTLERE